MRSACLLVASQGKEERSVARLHGQLPSNSPKRLLHCSPLYQLCLLCLSCLLCTQHTSRLHPHQIPC